MSKPDIEAYLNGDLRGDDLERFEAELARDPALREELEALRPLARDLNRMGIARRIELAGNRRVVRKRLRKNAGLLGVGLALMAGLGWYFLRKNAVEKPVLPETETPAIEVLPEKDRHLFPENLPAKPGLPGNENAPGPVKKPIAKNRPTAPTAEDGRLLAIAVGQYLLPTEYGDLRSETGNGPIHSAKIALAENRFDEALGLLGGNELADVAEAKYLRGHILFAKADYFGAWLAFSGLMEDPNWGGAAEWYGLLSGLASGGRVPKATLDSLMGKMVDNSGQPFRAVQALKLKALLEGR